MQSIINTALMCGTVITVTFFILLSLPTSRLRNFVLELVSWLGAGASVLYVVSPLDVLPDVVPVVGWADDVVAVVGGIAAIVTALKTRNERLCLPG